MSGKTRYPEIDLAKALCMLAVIWGHLMLGGITNQLAYAFHIPAFFFLSGMMFRREKYGSLWEFLGRRARTLLLPYAVFSVVTWAYWAARSALLGPAPGSYVRPLIQTVLAQGSGGFLVHNVALWFVTCLFLVEALYFILCRLPAWAAALGCALCGALGWALVQPVWPVDFTMLPWSAEAALTGVVFYGAGSLFARRVTPEAFSSAVLHRRAASTALCAALAALTAAGAHWNGHVTIAQGHLGDHVLLFYANAFCGTAAVLLASVLLADLWRRRAPRWIAGLLWLGRRSFYAMAIHIPVMVDVVWLTERLTGASHDACRYAYRCTIPEFLAILALTCLWIWLLGHIRAKWQNHKAAGH